MKMLYGYIFLKLYQMMKRTPGKKTADDAALWLLTIALFFYTVPFLLFVIDHSFEEIKFLILIILMLLYGYFVFIINKKHFIDNKELTLIIDRHKNESKMSSRVGYAAVIIFELFSFFAFFLSLSIL
jgi:Ca2+/Na+ antiporter